MRIAISTSPLSSGHKTRGVGVYTRELIAALKKNNSVSIHEFSTLSQIPKEIDLIHFTSFDPFFLTLPWFINKPFVLSVHDLIPFVFPTHFIRGIRGELKWQIQRRVASKAVRIITDSISSKNDITTILERTADTVDVISLAPSSAFNTQISSDSMRQVRTKYSLPARFAVYVGDVNWNKNIFGLLNAWHVLGTTATLLSGEKLYLVGEAFWGQSQEAQRVNRLIKELHLERSVICVGRVSDADLPTLLSLSMMCVLPSYYEGFGLPVVEAMAAGTIVVTTHEGSLKEIAGPSLICDPKDIDSIAQKILEAFSLSQTKREALIHEGHVWVKKFTWDHVAKETIAVYNRALGKS